MTRQDQPIICVIDDDQPVRDSLVSVLTVSDYRVVAFKNAESFLEQDCCPEASFLIVDVRLPGMSGIELLNTLASRKLERPTLIMTGHADSDSLRGTRGNSEIHYLQKPSEPLELLAIIEQSLARTG